MGFWGCLFSLLLMASAAQAEVSTRLLNRLERYANTLDTLEADIAKNADTLDTLSKDLTATQDNVRRERQRLMNDVSQMNVTVREAARLARYPWEAQILADLNTPRTPRHAILEQGQKALGHKLAQQRDALHHLLEQEKNLQNLLSQQVAATKTLQAKRDRITALHEKHLKTLKIQDKSLARKLERALPERHTLTLPDIEKKHLTPLPQALPLHGFILQRYGTPLEDGTRPDGTTLLGTPGASVKALRGGTVLFSGPFRDYGWLVILEDDVQQHEIYGGLAYPNVDVGDRVEKGQALGALPNVEDPQLYYEVRLQDAPVAPVF